MCVWRGPDLLGGRAAPLRGRPREALQEHRVPAHGRERGVLGRDRDQTLALLEGVEVTVSGSPELALSNARTLMGSAERQGGAEFEFSDRGDLAYVASGARASEGMRRLLRLTRNKEGGSVTDVARSYRYPRFSPAGVRVIG